MEKVMSKLTMKLALLAAILPLHIGNPSVAQNVETPVAEEKVSDDAKQLDDFLTKLALESMPVRYVEDKDWGKQSERWDGVKIRFENGKLRTKRRKKKVNHGTWDRYEVSLIDPENSFSVKLDNFKETGKDRVTFDVAITAKVDVEARQSKWIKGLQLYSVSANGSADIRLVLSVSLGSSMDFAKLPPDLIFDPKIEEADIQLSNFRIDRVSKAGGEFAQQITRLVKKKIDQKVAKKEEKLVDKLNAKIEKNRERFTLSVHDAMKSKWATAAQKLVDKTSEE